MLLLEGHICSILAKQVKIRGRSASRRHRGDPGGEWFDKCHTLLQVDGAGQLRDAPPSAQQDQEKVQEGRRTENVGEGQQTAEVLHGQLVEGGPVG